MANNILDELKDKISENSLTTILEGLQEISSSNDNTIKDTLIDCLTTNRYEASDEGKVVVDGALVAQTAHAKVIENSTIDTTMNNSVEVEVPNPNSIVTVTGTMADPWGNEFEAFTAAVTSNIYDVSAELAVDASALSMGTAYLQWDRRALYGVQFSSASLDATLANGSAATMLYTGFGGTTLSKALILTGGSIVDMSSYASALPTTLTIIYHPLPSGET